MLLILYDVEIEKVFVIKIYVIFCLLFKFGLFYNVEKIDL